MNLRTSIFDKVNLLEENIYEIVDAHNESKETQRLGTTDIMLIPVTIDTCTYYLRPSDNFFCKVDSESIDGEKVLIDQYVVDFDIVNGYVYYNVAGDTGLYKVDLNGQGIFKIIN